MTPVQPDEPEPTVDVVRSRLAIAADALAVRELPDWLHGLLAATGDEAATFQAKLELAVHEVCMNVIDHAYGPQHLPRRGDVIIDGEVDAAAIRIQIRDRGEGFDPASIATPVPGVPQIRGYGLVIVGKLADDLHFTRQGDTNICSLRFDRALDKQGKRS